MKKFIMISLLGLGVLGLTTGCNYNVMDTSYTYHTAICNVGGEYKEIKIKSWTDYEGEQLQIKDYEGNTYLVSSINCTLIG